MDTTDDNFAGASDLHTADLACWAAMEPVLSDHGGTWIAPERRRTAAGVVVAGMIGFAEALGWERSSPDTVEVADSPQGDDDLRLDFGHLEPLDP